MAKIECLATWLQSPFFRLMVPATIFLIILPFFTSSFWLHFFGNLFGLIAMAEAWNLISGYLHYLSFGHAAFYGLGVYMCALLNIRFGINPYVGSIMAGIGSMLAGAFLGYLCFARTLKLRGMYFSIVTLGFTEALLYTFNLPQLAWLTGGGSGLVFATREYSKISLYFAMLAVMVLAIIACYILGEKSNFAYAMKTIRNNERAAESIGLDVTKIKILSLMISAFITGVIGGLFGFFHVFVEPVDAFSSTLSFEVLIMTEFGGIATIAGPLIGTAMLYSISEWLRYTFLYINLIVFGCVLLFIIVVQPKGLVYFVENVIRKHRYLARK